MELERRRFSDGDTARIMRRAAELQRLEEQGAFDLSLGELEATAREAGLDPRHVRQAAAELVAPGTRKGGVFGSQPFIRLQQVLPFRLGADGFPAVIDCARALLDTAGEATMLPGGFTWTTAPPGRVASRAVTLALSVRAADTLLTIEEALEHDEIGYFSLVVIGAGSLGALGLTVGAIAFSPLWVAAPVWLGGTYLTGRRLFQRTLRRRTAELGAILEQVAASAVPPADATGLSRTAPSL